MNHTVLVYEATSHLSTPLEVCPVLSSSTDQYKPAFFRGLKWSLGNDKETVSCGLCVCLCLGEILSLNTLEGGIINNSLSLVENESHP